MGFSVAASLGSHIVLKLKGTHETRINCQFFCSRTEQNSVGFKYPKHNKAIRRAVSVSKQESIELDDRKSPIEVTVNAPT